MNAEAWIDYICESPKDTIYAYVPRLTDVYGIGIPPKSKEDPFATWTRQFVKTTGMNKILAPEYAQTAVQDPEQFVDILLGKFDAVIITVLNGLVDVYSRKRRPKLPKQFLDKVERFLDIWPDTDVGWFQSVNANPVPTVAAEVIYGLEPEDVEYERNRPKMSKPVGTHAKSEIRRKFWGQGGYDPATAPDIVDKLLQ